MNQELYQQLILDHNKHPHNYGELVQHTHKSEGYNPLCGDHIWLQLIVSKDPKAIQEVAFNGQCCAISKASASLMTSHLKGKTLEEVEEVFEQFRNLVLGKEKPETLKASLGKLIVFEGIKAYPSRIKCVLLAWHTVMAALAHREVSESESLY